MKKQIIFVGSMPRSGSTLLGKILNEAADTFCVGESFFLTHPKFVNGVHCGCGVKHKDCSFWSSILANDPALDLKNTQAPNFLRTREFYKVYLGFGDKHLKEALTPEHRNYFGNLFGKITEETGSHKIVDLSKFISHGWVLSQLEDFEFTFVHLVRHPLGVAASHAKKKAFDPISGAEFPKENPFRTVFRWILWNAFLNRVGRRISDRFISVKYEDLVSQPQKVQEMICGRNTKTGSAEQNPFKTNHFIAGNPSKFAESLSLSEDTGWRDQLPKWVQVAGLALTFPWLKKYHY